MSIILFVERQKTEGQYCCGLRFLLPAAPSFSPLCTSEYSLFLLFSFLLLPIQPPSCLPLSQSTHLKFSFLSFLVIMFFHFLFPFCHLFLYCFTPSFPPSSSRFPSVPQNPFHISSFSFKLFHSYSVFAFYKLYLCQIFVVSLTSPPCWSTFPFLNPVHLTSSLSLSPPYIMYQVSSSLFHSVSFCPFYYPSFIVSPNIHSSASPSYGNDKYAYLSPLLHLFLFVQPSSPYLASSRPTFCSPSDISVYN